MSSSTSLPITATRRAVSPIRRPGAGRLRRRAPTPTTRVGLMGLGSWGWTRRCKLKPSATACGLEPRPQGRAGVESFAGPDELGAFLARTDILVCLLPLTGGDARYPQCGGHSRSCCRGARIINAAARRHLVEADLLRRAGRGRIGGATLDVFEREPLPGDEPAWSHPKVIVTPHIAALTDARPPPDRWAESMSAPRGRSLTRSISGAATERLKRSSTIFAFGPEFWRVSGSIA